jgi:hypothetical protein
MLLDAFKTTFYVHLRNYMYTKLFFLYTYLSTCTQNSIMYFCGGLLAIMC